jgi:uncharacterized damage-inducible protein DinB
MTTPPKHPAGEYAADPAPAADRRAELIAQIEAAPAALRAAVAGLTDAQLDTKYVNWTARQIAHHMADSHLNAFARFKLALTEDAPTIKPYGQDAWAGTADVLGEPVETSVRLLEALHARWVRLLRSMGEADFARTFVHPEYGKTYTLGEALGVYAHHGRHHTAQIAWLRQHHGW